jgi:hypothetical protein
VVVVGPKSRVEGKVSLLSDYPSEPQILFQCSILPKRFRAFPSGNGACVVIQVSQRFYVLSTSFKMGIRRWLIVQNAGNRYKKARVVSTAVKTKVVPSYLYGIPINHH